MNFQWKPGAKGLSYANNSKMNLTAESWMVSLILMNYIRSSASILKINPLNTVPPRKSNNHLITKRFSHPMVFFQIAVPKNLKNSLENNCSGLALGNPSDRQIIYSDVSDLMAASTATSY